MLQLVDIAFERISELGWWMIGAYLKDLEFSKLNLAIRMMLLNSCSAHKEEQISSAPVLGDIGKAIALKLRLRDCLSVKCFDLLGLAMPVKMTGNLLFRQTLQAMKVGQTVKNIPWDQIVPSPLLDCWLKYLLC